MHGFEMILCKTGLFPIQRLIPICDILHGENFESFLFLAMYLCGVHYVDNCVFRKYVTLLGWLSG